MSLINQMLKDLDARHPQPPEAHAVALQGLGLAGQRGTSRPLPWGRLATAVTLISLTAALLVLQPWDRPDAAVPDFPVDNRLVRPAPAVAPVVEPRSTTEQAPVTPAVPETTVIEQTAGDTASGTETRQQNPAATPVAAPVTKTATSRAVVRLNRRQRAQLAFKRALQLQDRGDDPAAEPLLRKALSLDPGLNDARVQLAALLLRERRMAEAEALLLEGLARRPDRLALAELYARLLAERGDNGRALEVLDTAGAAHSDIAEVRALRAGILMKLGDARNAARDYRKALAARPQHAVWWMGLGVALEQAREPAPALAAYRRARSLPLAAELDAFVAKRIAALGSGRRDRE